jgi:tetratricopeptide (TPR) repeat protein
MKTLKFILFSAIFLMAFFYCKAGDEKKAIQEVIDNEYKAYLDGNFDEWSACWIHEPFVSQSYSGSFQYSKINTYDSLAAFMKKTFNDGTQAGQKIEKKVTGLKIIDNIAFVDLDESLTFNFFGQEFGWNGKSLYVLKKVDGNWKFISQNCVRVSNYVPSDTNTEFHINISGYLLLNMKKTDEALKVFRLNTELYPESFNTWDSLAEAYMVKGEKAEAEKYYNKSLEINPDNTNAKKRLEKLKEK